MYKPNFCADCGTRIARARWRLWTSRRFCQTCARRLRRSSILFPLIAGLMLFSIGLIAGRSARPSPPPLTIGRGQVAPLPQTAQGADTKAEKNNAPAASNPDSSYGADGTAQERPTDPNEVVSICGARTQKGTPCSRRVRGTGRCWQHKGKPAMLPPEKLIVTEN